MKNFWYLMTTAVLATMLLGVSIMVIGMLFTILGVNVSFTVIEVVLAYVLAYAYVYTIRGLFSKEETEG